MQEQVVVGIAEVFGGGSPEAVEQAVDGDTDRPTCEIDVEGQAERLAHRLHLRRGRLTGIGLRKAPGAVEPGDEVVPVDGPRCSPAGRGEGKQCRARNGGCPEEPVPHATRGPCTRWAVTARSKASLRIRRSK